MDIDLSPLETILGATFKDKTLLSIAVTHRSFLNENRAVEHDHNERLEFLGDAVLELVVTDFLFSKFEDKAEGELTAIRAALVNTNTLSEVASRLGINDFLRLSRGEAKDTGRARQYILANAFEAVTGALYLDQGYNAARDFIARELLIRTDDIVDKRLWQDPKSRFQEKAQEVLGKTPTYKTLKEEGPDHDRTFTIGVFLGDEQIAQGMGRSKQEAEQAAAIKGNEAKGW
ncbi:ribonuclease III [Patescibacteria group bacterium]|jgi:ribonuclease-3|nr:ribonuclease III [Patescibacteria group bacterium]